MKGNVLKELIMSRGMTIDEFCERIGEDRATVDHYISGVRPSKAVANKMSKVLKVSAEFLITGSDSDSSFDVVQSIIKKCNATWSDEQKLKLVRVLTR